MDARLLSSYRWFRGRTGCVGRDAEMALALSRAELAAQWAGCVWEWRTDGDGWSDFYSDSRRYGARPTPESIEGCILYGPDGEHLASLWAIEDADDDYRRMVQADLALEAQDALLAYAI